MILGQARSQRSLLKKYLSSFVKYTLKLKNFSHLDYKEVDGSPKLFLGNEDGDYVVRNDFDQPIIAQWLRINPTRWADRISMRVELYGCEYIPGRSNF